MSAYKFSGANSLAGKWSEPGIAVRTLPLENPAGSSRDCGLKPMHHAYFKWKQDVEIEAIVEVTASSSAVAAKLHRVHEPMHGNSPSNSPEYDLMVPESCFPNMTRGVIREPIQGTCSGNPPEQDPRST